MATTTLTVISERWLDEILLNATILDVAGASINENFVLPQGVGDVAIMSCVAVVPAVATVPVSATVARGVHVVINSSDGTTQLDYVGVAEWFARGGLGAAFTDIVAFVDPDALCLFREGELLNIRAPELDANAAPTGDLAVNIKCVRVRPIEGAAQPVRLVR